MTRKRPPSPLIPPPTGRTRPTQPREICRTRPDPNPLGNLVSHKPSARRSRAAHLAPKPLTNDLATRAISVTYQKSAQPTENKPFQLPVFSDSCALFPCIPFVLNNLTKTGCCVSASRCCQRPKVLLEVLSLGTRSREICPCQLPPILDCEPSPRVSALSATLHYPPQMKCGPRTRANPSPFAVTPRNCGKLDAGGQNGN
jgi:hypothetical protein